MSRDPLYLLFYLAVFLIVVYVILRVLGGI